MMMQRTDIEYLKRVSDLLESGSKIRRRACGCYQPHGTDCELQAREFSFCSECDTIIKDRWDRDHTIMIINDEIAIAICCEGYHALYDGTNDLS